MYDFLIKKDALIIILTITLFTCVCVITVVLKMARVFLSYMYMYKEEKSYFLQYIIVHKLFSLYTVLILLLIAIKERSNFTICYEVPVFVVPSVALDCEQHIWFGIFSQWS